MACKFFLYAPNVHTGGGAVLLKELLLNTSNGSSLSAILDKRIYDQLDWSHLKNTDVKYWVSPNFLSRFFSEIVLWKMGKNYKILCFHNIPPIFAKSKNIIVFFQNRLIIEAINIKNINLTVFFIANFERVINKLFNRKVTTYIVQTSSMKRDLKKTILKNSKSEIIILPFLSEINKGSERFFCKKQWDFVYVSSGDSHKNHLNLIRAWKLLASENIFPTLALTVNKCYSNLFTLLEREHHEGIVKITNLGQIAHDTVLELYSNTNALIFPSNSESFGLPLIEASSLGIPIIASELDFVRDVCVPTETFDPNSPMSIARAVKRFLKINETPVEFISAKEFWKRLR